MIVSCCGCGRMTGCCSGEMTGDATIGAVAAVGGAVAAAVAVAVAVAGVGTADVAVFVLFARSWYRFSKVSSIVDVFGEFSRELPFENLYPRRGSILKSNLCSCCVYCI